MNFDAKIEYWCKRVALLYLGSGHESEGPGVLIVEIESGLEIFSVVVLASHLHDFYLVAEHISVRNLEVFLIESSALFASVPAFLQLTDHHTLHRCIEHYLFIHLFILSFYIYLALFIIMGLFICLPKFIIGFMYVRLCHRE